MSILNNGISIGLLLATNDVISMTLTKNIVLGNLVQTWLVLTFILYGLIV